MKVTGLVCVYVLVYVHVCVLVYVYEYVLVYVYVYVHCIILQGECILHCIGLQGECIIMYIVLAYGDVTSFINQVAILGFFADAYFLTSAGHRQIFSTLNHVVKVMQRTPAGRRWETIRPLPDSLCR